VTVGVHPSFVTVDLAIDGMTCSSCVARVEKRLGRLDGVRATVNLATERARVVAPASLGTEALLAEVARAGYGARVVVAAEPGPADTGTLRKRLVVSAVLALPVVALAMVPAWQFPGWQWLSLVLTLPVVVWGGLPFHRATFANLRHGAVTMDTLVTIGTGAALAWSVGAMVFGSAGELGMRHSFSLTVAPGGAASAVYFEVAAGVTVFLLLGRFIEERSKRAAGSALRSLLEVGARSATRLDPDGSAGDRVREVSVPVEALKVGDLFRVRPGEKVPTDGIVIDGGAAVDLSALTGESVPVDVAPGREVSGAAIVHGGSIVVRATRVGADTQLARMARIVEEAQTGSSGAQRLADRVSAVFVPVVLALAAVTVAGWLLAGGTPSEALTAAVAVLIVACPCALGLATPVALLVGTGRAAQQGILVTGPEALEKTRRIDTIVFDKTGTLTTGRMRLTGVTLAPGESEDVTLRRAAAVERLSEHPIAHAVVAGWSGRMALASAPVPEVGEFRSLAGFGVVGIVENVRVSVGRPDQLASHQLRDTALDPALQDAIHRAAGHGATAVLVAWDGRMRAVLEVGDTVRPDAASAVARLRELGLAPVLLTGDSAAAARAVAQELGIDDVVAGVLPTQKVETVRALQADGRAVAMVGDGVNDAAALAQADLGIAMGSGADAALHASDITLVRSEPTAVVDAVLLARRTVRVIRGNLFWAFAYNIAALPVAALGLLNPMIAGGAMAFSSVFVVGNSLRLRRDRRI
jgi:Cu+-exporting ATPase